MRIDGFEWDEGNLPKCGKHGVPIGVIERMFQGEVRVAPDLAHSDSEERFIAIGRDHRHKPLFVAFTIREVAGRRLIRPISARYMHAKEVRRYEADF